MDKVINFSFYGTNTYMFNELLIEPPKIIETKTN